jgi:hypothetical protein
MKIKPCLNWKDVENDPRVEFCIVASNKKGFWVYLKPAFINIVPEIRLSGVTNFVYSENPSEVYQIMNKFIQFVP